MKCATCQKKLQLVETVAGKCKCQQTFCTLHRLAEKHACLYDYKTTTDDAVKEYVLKNKCVQSKIAVI